MLAVSGQRGTSGSPSRDFDSVAAAPASCLLACQSQPGYTARECTQQAHPQADKSRYTTFRNCNCHYPHSPTTRQAGRQAGRQGTLGRQRARSRQIGAELAPAIHAQAQTSCSRHDCDGGVCHTRGAGSCVLFSGRGYLGRGFSGWYHRGANLVSPAFPRPEVIPVPSTQIGVRLPDVVVAAIDASGIERAAFIRQAVEDRLSVPVDGDGFDLGDSRLAGQTLRMLDGMVRGAAKGREARGWDPDPCPELRRSTSCWMIGSRSVPMRQWRS